jgi:hypothetical protein
LRRKCKPQQCEKHRLLDYPICWRLQLSQQQSVSGIGGFQFFFANLLNYLIGLLLSAHINSNAEETKKAIEDKKLKSD